MVLINKLEQKRSEASRERGGNPGRRKRGSFCSVWFVWSSSSVAKKTAEGGRSSDGLVINLRTFSRSFLGQVVGLLSHR